MPRSHPCARPRRARGGERHIFSPRGDDENFSYGAEVKISDKGNSREYFRIEFGKEPPAK